MNKKGGELYLHGHSVSWENNYIAETLYLMVKAQEKGIDTHDLWDFVLEHLDKRQSILDGDV